jgi:hypothetical protein
MAGNMEGHGAQMTDLKSLAVHQAIELRTIAREAGRFVEYVIEDVLNGHNLAPDDQSATKLLLEIRSIRQMVGIG